MMESKTKKNLVWVGILLALLALCAVLLLIFKPKASVGDKKIGVDIIHKDGTVHEFVITTDAEYLRQALEQEDLISGNESTYGLYILSADGETADEANQEWWGITKNGEMVNYGVDEQPIEDGEHYELTCNVGW